LSDILINGRKKTAEYIVKTEVKNVDILPCDGRLASAEVELASTENREYALKNTLDGLSYDYILIDCPPSLGLLTINALTSADLVLIPVQAEYYALEGLSQLLQVMQQVRKGLNADLELLGVAMTMYDKRTSLSEQVYNEVKEHFGEKVFKTVIPRNVKLAEAPSFNKPISDHDRWSKGARAYKALAKELKRRVDD
jgi:chromosome partitioning protein